MKKNPTRRVANKSLTVLKVEGMREFITSVFYRKHQKTFASCQITWHLNILILEDLFLTLCYREGYCSLKPPLESSQWFYREGVLRGLLIHPILKGTSPVRAGPRAVLGGGICSSHYDLNVALGTLSEHSTVVRTGQVLLLRDSYSEGYLGRSSSPKWAQSETCF